MLFPIAAMVLIAGLLLWVKWGCRPVTRIIAGKNLVEALEGPPRKKNGGDESRSQSWDLSILRLNR